MQIQLSNGEPLLKGSHWLGAEHTRLRSAHTLAVNEFLTERFHSHGQHLCKHIEQTNKAFK